MSSLIGFSIGLCPRNPRELAVRGAGIEASLALFAAIIRERSRSIVPRR